MFLGISVVLRLHIPHLDKPHHSIYQLTLMSQVWSGPRARGDLIHVQVVMPWLCHLGDMASPGLDALVAGKDNVWTLWQANTEAQHRLLGSYSQIQPLSNTTSLLFKKKLPE